MDKMGKDIIELIYGDILSKTKDGIIRPVDMIRAYQRNNSSYSLYPEMFTIVLGEESGKRYYNNLKETGDKFYYKFTAFIKYRQESHTRKEVDKKCIDLCNNVRELLEKRFGLTNQVEFKVTTKGMKDFADIVSRANDNGDSQSVKGVNMISLLLRATRIVWEIPQITE